MFENFEVRDFLDVERFVNQHEKTHDTECEMLATNDAPPDDDAFKEAAIAGA